MGGGTISKLPCPCSWRTKRDILKLNNSLKGKFCGRPLWGGGRCGGIHLNQGGFLTCAAPRGSRQGDCVISGGCIRMRWILKCGGGAISEIPSPLRGVCRSILKIYNKGRGATTRGCDKISDGWRRKNLNQICFYKSVGATAVCYFERDGEIACACIGVQGGLCTGGGCAGGTFGAIPKIPQPPTWTPGRQV